MSKQATTVVVYADYVCPFCYLGYASFDQYREERDGEHSLEVDWHPFDLRAHQRRPDGSIDHSVETGKDDAYFEQAKQNVERLGVRSRTEAGDYRRTDFRRGRPRRPRCSATGTPSTARRRYLTSDTEYSRMNWECLTCIARESAQQARTRPPAA